jgi:RimJ/RimL family protein N-acetyltransferase
MTIPIPLPIGFSTWAVVEKESGTVVGDVGLGVYEPTGEPELGYTLAAVWGRGYGLEAARAGVAAFEHLPARRLVAETISVDGRPHHLLALEQS